MVEKIVSEQSAKRVFWEKYEGREYRGACIESVEDVSKFVSAEEAEGVPEARKYVFKVDQGIKGRGKLGLVHKGVRRSAVGSLYKELSGKEISKEGKKVRLQRFLVEPEVEVEGSQGVEEIREYYVALVPSRDFFDLVFSVEGGVGFDIDTSASGGNCIRWAVPVDDEERSSRFEAGVGEKLSACGLEKKQRAAVLAFCWKLIRFATDFFVTFLEVNPFVVVGGEAKMLDIAMKVDPSVSLIVSRENIKHAKALRFQEEVREGGSVEEKYVEELDAKSGSSLKLSVINPAGSIWTMVAGGGASMVFADTICSMGLWSELANSGEYSGAPSESLTYEYAKTLLGLMLRSETAGGKRKILFIAGGIANFTDVTSTFRAIARTLEENCAALKAEGVRAYIRRGGPNFRAGLELMRSMQKRTGLDITIYSHEECSLTGILEEAIEGKKPRAMTVEDLKNRGKTQAVGLAKFNEMFAKGNEEHFLFNSRTRIVVYGMKPNAIQSMLDFDFACGKKAHCVGGVISPMMAQDEAFTQFFWGDEAVAIRSFRSIGGCLAQIEEGCNVALANYASARSAYESTMEALAEHPDRIKCVMIMAENVPDQLSKRIRKKAEDEGVVVIGPASVGVVSSGICKIGQISGMLSNQVSCKLFRPGPVAFVCRSGGLSNELNYVLKTAGGVCEGVAIGGEKYPCSGFLPHMERFEKNPLVEVMVMVGENGGMLEYDVIEAMKNGRITKPVVAWVMGTCSSYFSDAISFGHAAATSNSKDETAQVKNKALTEAGCIVPNNFAEIADVARKIVAKRSPRLLSYDIVDCPSKNESLLSLTSRRTRKNFIVSMTREVNGEPYFRGKSVLGMIKNNSSIGKFVSLMWLGKELPEYGCQLIETILKVVSDHGPCVSGAMNSIITARAGKDLVSSLCAGLLTIGERFGGAIDKAAKNFFAAHLRKQSPEEFVQEYKNNKKLIMGIGHRIYSAQKGDKRVELLIEFSRKHNFKREITEFAKKVEQITLQKRNNLILNIDGTIAVVFLDMLITTQLFTSIEISRIVNAGVFNGLFVLGRSIGLMGHFFDQKRLNQGLYRHPEKDILFLE